MLKLCPLRSFRPNKALSNDLTFSKENNYTLLLAGSPKKQKKQREKKKKEMESFALAAEHSGAINHIHTITISPSVVGIAREVRLMITAVVVGWVCVTGIQSLARARPQQGAQK